MTTRLEYKGAPLVSSPAPRAQTSLSKPPMKMSDLTSMLSELDAILKPSSIPTATIISPQPAPAKKPTIALPSAAPSQPVPAKKPPVEKPSVKDDKEAEALLQQMNAELLKTAQQVEKLILTCHTAMEKASQDSPLMGKLCATSECLTAISQGLATRNGEIQAFDSL